MPESAELKAISPEAMAAYRYACPDLIKDTVAESLKETCNVEEFGEQAERIVTSGLVFTTRMLEAAMAMGSKIILKDEIEWAQDRLPHDGVDMMQVVCRIKILRRQIINRIQPALASEITAYVDWLLHLLAQPRER